MAIGSLGVVLLAAPGVSAQTPDAEYPREIKSPEATIVVYQPQLESFKGDRLTARAAVSITPQGKTEPVFGAVWFIARVLTDRDTRMVTLLDIDVRDAKFPNSKRESTEKLAAALKRDFAKTEHVISLDRLLTALELVEKEQAAAETLNNEPPKIIHVTYPAVLVTLDGKPELRPIENSKLMRIVNTPFLIVLDPASKAYYLKGGDEWLTAADVMGPWQSESKPPAEVVALAEDAPSPSGAEKRLAASTDKKPRVIVATEPTELIISDGEPKYTPIQGTGLLYMSNTDDDVLIDIASQKHYVLLAGRWFAAPALNGPWSFVPADKLPSDFKRIPPSSEKGELLASVAGTAEARDAVQESYIPQTAQIDRKTTISVTYDGSPKFERIEGTTMTYAVNTSYSVIQVDKSYYCCHEAVWYVSPQPTGPWVVCVSVPQVIYTIPPTSPLYPVKYVYVYQSTPTTVYVGYTAGYVGCYPYGGAVVFGTGYVYAGWRGAVYYPRPVTFGFGVHYNSVTGNWGFRVGVSGPNGWIVGGYHNGKYVTWGWVAGGGWGGGIHGGWWGHGSNYPGPGPYYHGNINVNRNVTVNNINGGNRVYAGHGDNIYNRTTNIDRNVQRPPTGDRPVQPPAVRPSGTAAGRTPANDLFSDRDGNVYRRTDEGWQKHTDSGWTQPERPAQSADRSARPSDTPSGLSRQPSSLDGDYSARQRGEQRTNSFREYERSGGRGARGGFRGLGGRR